MYTVADSVHLRMDSSTQQHTLLDACTICTMYTTGKTRVHTGKYVPHGITESGTITWAPYATNTIDPVQIVARFCTVC